jgi:hypothetical protein
VRFIPGDENGGAAHTMWAGICFNSPLLELTDKEFSDKVIAAANKNQVKRANAVTTYATFTVPHHPEFTIDSWGHSASPPTYDGLEVNDCWPKDIAAKDPGFALLLCDPYYGGKAPPYDYSAAYKKGTNGS